MLSYWKTPLLQTLFALSLSSALLALWVILELPAVILPSLIFVQWLPTTLGRRFLSCLATPRPRTLVCLLFVGLLAGISFLLVGS